MKRTWFQIHWALGIGAGIVLAVVGVTGACLSFQDEILHWLNPVAVSERQEAQRLSPVELLAHIETMHPEKRIVSLTVYSAGDRAARIMFAPLADAASGSSRRRSEVHYINLYTGEMLGEPRGAAFFRAARETHRWLAAGAIGKQVVGASTLALVVMCLSGLYLRWPRRALDWRAWLMFDWRRRGRKFLRDLHACVGTWVLAPYLVMGLTGLYWSYDWYRDALYALTGAPRPAARIAAPPSDSSGPQRSGRLREKPALNAAQEKKQRDLTAAWSAFDRIARGYSSATLRVPERTGQPVQITYLHADSAHDPAFDRVVLDARSGTVLKHERYADKPPGARLVSSMFALHSGRLFGVPGVIALMLASALMPLFTITGWMLYLGRRTKKRRTALAAHERAASSDAPEPASSRARVKLMH